MERLEGGAMSEITAAAAPRGGAAIDDIDPEALRDSLNRVVRVAVELLGGVGGEVAIRRPGGVWRTSGRIDAHAPIAHLVEASEGALWIEDWTCDARIDQSLVEDRFRATPLYVGAPIRLADGRVLGVLSVVCADARPRDDAKADRLMDLAGLIADDVERHRAILARTRAEAEAAAARATVTALVENAPFAVSMTDRDLRLLQVSQRWREDRGLRDADIIGRPMHELFDDDGWADAHARVLAGETVLRKAQLRLRDGRTRWIRIEHTPWREAGGAIGGLLSMSVEISEVMEALQRAEESEQRLKLALEIGELRMWEVDLRARTVTDAGAVPDFARPQTFEDLTDGILRGVHPHDRHIVETAWSEHLAGRPFSIVVRLMQPNGPHIWVQCASEAIRDENGEVLRIVNALRDIDKTKRAEINLQRARDAAEAANRAKSEFLANMSHEIRTPLNGVMGVASALGRTELSAAQREMVGLIASSAETLESLLSDVLDLARIESGRLELKAEPFDLVQSAADVAALFEPSARAKGLALTLETAPEAAGRFVGDAPRVRQVLSNLAANAVKFTGEGAVAIRLAARPAEAGVAFSMTVSDTGIGFDAEAAQRLFERFEQADGSITRRYGGTGLGLAISRSLAEAMGGRLSATSRPGQGSTFTFELTLPRAVEAEAMAPAAVAPAAQADFRRTRVLLAEDHPTNRRVVELILGAAGVDLTCVKDGAEAVEAWSAGHYDLILMDMQMPVMDGLTATRAIREAEVRRGGPRTPIYSLTANAMPEHARASKDAGADGHLTKPISADALLRTVSLAASGAAPDSPSVRRTARR
jgi:PAS domain S-box-containing protein